MTQQENCSNLDMLSIQKITAFVNDCVTFRQKTPFYATSSGLFSTRALVRPSGRISPAAVSAILVSVGPTSSYTSTENSTSILSAQIKRNRNMETRQRAPVGQIKETPSVIAARCHPFPFWHFRATSPGRGSLSHGGRLWREGEVFHSAKCSLFEGAGTA